MPTETRARSAPRPRAGDDAAARRRLSRLWRLSKSPAKEKIRGQRAPGSNGRRSKPKHRKTSHRRWFRPRWIILVLLLALLLPSGWSYAKAVRAPGNDPLSVKSVEWVRQHHGRGLVNAVERYWYSHHKPKAGGTPKHGLPTAGTGAAGSAVKAPSPESRFRPPPVPIVPIASPALPDEGQWKPLGELVHGRPAMYAAFLRPDNVHTSLVTGVAWMDPRMVRAVGYAGVVEPGGGPWRIQAPVPVEARPWLLAAFNSGFRIMDSRGGYYAEGRMWRPLKDGAATLVINPDGIPDVGEWGRDFQLTPRVAFARQNLQLIVDHGEPAAGIEHDNYTKWGFTLGNAQLVWRSGVGVTAGGALVYAAGNGLSAGSLAHVLAAAGAERAMELDINSSWVDFFTYGPALPGHPAAALSVQKLLPDMRPPLNRYLTESSRDFIAIFAR